MISSAVGVQEADLARLRIERVEIEKRIAILEATLPETYKELNARLSPEIIDTTPIRERIASAESRNSAFYAAERGRDAQKLATRENEKVVELTRQIEDLDEIKRATMAAAKFPVEGLGFGDGEVTMNGLPFSQASSAEQLRASVALAMASNPTLRVLRIKDGSLLDEDSLAIVASMAEAEDYQIWIERVETSGTVGVVMVDGMVAGAE